MAMYTLLFGHAEWPEETRADRPPHGGERAEGRAHRAPQPPSPVPAQAARRGVRRARGRVPRRVDRARALAQRRPAPAQLVRSIVEETTAMYKTFETPEPIDIDVRFGAGELAVEGGRDGRDRGPRRRRSTTPGARRSESVRVELRGGRPLVEVPERRGFFGRSRASPSASAAPSARGFGARTRSADVRGARAARPAPT